MVAYTDTSRYVKILCKHLNETVFGIVFLFAETKRVCMYFVDCSLSSSSLAQLYARWYSYRISKNFMRFMVYPLCIAECLAWMEYLWKSSHCIRNYCWHVWIGFQNLYSMRFLIHHCSFITLSQHNPCVYVYR